MLKVKKNTVARIIYFKKYKIKTIVNFGKFEHSIHNFRLGKMRENKIFYIDSDCPSVTARNSTNQNK